MLIVTFYVSLKPLCEKGITISACAAYNGDGFGLGIIQGAPKNEPSISLIPPKCSVLQHWEAPPPVGRENSFGPLA